jgi:hypothetical protein
MMINLGGIPIMIKIEDLKDEDIISVNAVLEDFEESLKVFEPNSQDALALVIFINSCYDLKKLSSNKYDALVHFSKARKSANILYYGLNSVFFDLSIPAMHGILLRSRITYPDLLLP